VNTRALAASRPTVLLAAVAGLALSMVWVISPVLGTQPDPLHKVTICHRTDSDTNPYVQITVDEASVDGNTGNDHGKGDYLAEHQGAVWAGPNTPKEPKWGDIIPPFFSDGVTLTGYPSLNWNAAGMAIFDNRCKPAERQSQSEVESQSQVESQSEAESQSEVESQSQAESQSQVESQSQKASQSGEGSELGGTGTPEGSVSNGAVAQNGVSPVPTLLFSLILLASLAGLAYANVKTARSRS
jgi:hypothetical protein